MQESPFRRGSAAFHGAVILVAVALASAIAASPAAQGQVGAEAEPTVEALRREIDALRRDYAARIAALEERLARLEGRTDETIPAAEADLAALRAAASDAAAAPAPELELPAEAIGGRERNLNRLNPELSATGILLGNSTSEREEFDAQEFEVDLQASLDPFSRFRLTLALGEGEVEVEEGYVVYNSLPGGLELTAGKFRQRFGPLNRQHLHALPQSDYPLVYQLFFGEEGLAQTGLGLAWLLPRPWASANELILEVTDGENETAFAGESFEDFSLLAHLKNFWDLSNAAYLEWGLSGISGKTATGGDSRIWGTDLTFQWRPPARAKYRELTWRSELLRSERDDETGRRRRADGIYTYLEGLVARNLSLGVRLDRVDDPLDPNRELRAIAPYVTWWQSEFVRLRAEYSYVEERPGAESDDRFTLQLTWAAGPHKHETY
jgi:hypothetical protein